jgi:hypothetical protein
MPARDWMDWDPRFCERSPLFEPLVPLAGRFAGEVGFPAIARWNELLGEGIPVRFAEQPPAPRGRRRLDLPRPHYSARIHREKVVPSRAGSWHDFFNALVWGTFVRSKQALHARQDAAVASWASEDARRLPNRRTRELDTLALFDEGGAIVVADARHAEPVAWDGEEPPPGIRVLVFGHAIYESLMLREAPASCRASTAVVRVDRLPGNQAALLEAADRGLASLLEDAELFRQPKPEPGLLLKLRG